MAHENYIRDFFILFMIVFAVHQELWSFQESEFLKILIGFIGRVETDEIGTTKHNFQNTTRKFA